MVVSGFKIFGGKGLAIRGGLLAPVTKHFAHKFLRLKIVYTGFILGIIANFHCKC